MGKQFLRAFCERAAEATEAGSPIRFVASTEGIKRDGQDLQADSWLLDNYRKNPVFLWAHDYMGRTLPIGRSDITIGANQLVADVSFDQKDEFARQVEQKYRDGYLHAVSVGWDDIRDGAITRHELLDISGVPVPGDPDALMERQYRALQEIVHPADERGAIPPHTTPKAREEILWDGDAEMVEAEGKEQFRRMCAWVDDGDPDAGQSYKLAHHKANGEVVWRGVAAAMSRLFHSATQIPESDRQGVYTHLARHYRQFEKEPPELRPAAELEALGPDLIRGLFLHEEFVEDQTLRNDKARVGAVLNARNRGDLEQAVELIQAVLERASKEEPQTETHHPGEPERGQAEDIARLLSLKLKLEGI